MLHEKYAFRVGSVLLCTLALGVGVMIYIPNSWFSGPKRDIVVRFPSRLRLPLLNVGSQVYVGGQSVGNVSNVALEEQPVNPQLRPNEKDHYVVITARVRADLPLRSDAKIVPEGPPLGGPGILILEPGYADSPLSGMIEGSDPSGFAAVLETMNQTLGMELDANNPTSLLGRIKLQLDPAQQASLIARIHTSLGDINAITTALRVQLDPMERDALMARVNRVIVNLEETSLAIRNQMDAERPDVLLTRVLATIDDFRKSLGEVNAILVDARAPINTTLTHVAHTAETLDTRIIEDIARQTDPENPAGLIARIHIATDDLIKSLNNVTVVTDTARQVVVLNRDNINETLRNLAQTSDHIKTSIKFVLRRPWLLFNKPDAIDTRQKDILDATREFQDAAARLDHATTDLKALSDLHDGAIPADDVDLQRIRQSIESAFEKFKAAEAALWEQLPVR